MIVMPANSTGWFWHSLARETGRLGHLYSPRQQRGPWPWLPYALDNGAFACWTPATNSFDHARWAETELAWRSLLFWAQAAPIPPRWAIVPDVPGNAEKTIGKWFDFAPEVASLGIPLALAAQDGMTVEGVRKLDPQPEVICIGGTTEWKWRTVEMWVDNFERVHLLRCNAPEKLPYLEGLGIESCDGTGWNRGDRKQTRGLEEWARLPHFKSATIHPLWPHVCRASRDPKTQEVFA